MRMGSNCYTGDGRGGSTEYLELAYTNSDIENGCLRREENPASEQGFWLSVSRPLIAPFDGMCPGLNLIQLYEQHIE